jgi:hypothetical protein
MDKAELLEAQMGVIVADLLGGANIPKAVVAQKYVHGQPLVSDERYHQLPTHNAEFECLVPSCLKV